MRSKAYRHSNVTKSRRKSERMQSNNDKDESILKYKTIKIGVKHF